MLPSGGIEGKYTWRTALTVAFICLLHGFAVIFISTFFALARPQYLEIWATSLGLMAVTLALIQYLPQIWMTWSLGHVGSLSIPMMLIQTPGSFVLSASLAARLGLGGWSNWGVFLVTGCLQGSLLVMGICFEIKARREADLDEGGGVSVVPKFPSNGHSMLTLSRLVLGASLVISKIDERWPRQTVKQMSWLKMNRPRGHHLSTARRSLYKISFIGLQVNICIYI